jgi:hypothetical protein
MYNSIYTMLLIRSPLKKLLQLAELGNGEHHYTLFI